MAVYLQHNTTRAVMGGCVGFCVCLCVCSCACVFLFVYVRHTMRDRLCETHFHRERRRGAHMHTPARTHTCHTHAHPVIRRRCCRVRLCAPEARRRARGAVSAAASVLIHRVAMPPANLLIVRVPTRGKPTQCCAFAAEAWSPQVCVCVCVAVAVCVCVCVCVCDGGARAPVCVRVWL